MGAGVSEFLLLRIQIEKRIFFFFLGGGANGRKDEHAQIHA